MSDDVAASSVTAAASSSSDTSRTGDSLLRSAVAVVTSSVHASRIGLRVRAGSTSTVAPPNCAGGRGSWGRSARRARTQASSSTVAPWGGLPSTIADDQP
jgi:hypothetical protein